MISPRLTPIVAMSLSVTAVVAMSQSKTDRDVSVPADQAGSRSYSLDMAAARPDDTVDDIADALDCAASYSDDSCPEDSFYDYLSDDEDDDRALEASITAASTCSTCWAPVPMSPGSGPPRAPSRGRAAERSPTCCRSAQLGIPKTATAAIANTTPVKRAT